MAKVLGCCDALTDCVRAGHQRQSPAPEEAEEWRQTSHTSVLPSTVQRESRVLCVVLLCCAPLTRCPDPVSSGADPAL